MTRTRKSLISIVIFVSGTLAVAETYHYYRYGHLFGYGLHTDVITSSAGLSVNDFYEARIWNLSVNDFQIEGCRMPGGFAGGGLLYSWDVQKLDSSKKRWLSLRGADNWVQTPFGAYDNEYPCNRPEITRIHPLQMKAVAWVYKDWVTTGEPIRMAIHPAPLRRPDDQRIIYTQMFVVKEPPGK